MENTQTTTNQKVKRSCSTNSFGWAGFWVSLFGLIFTCGLLSPLGFFFSFLGLFSKNRGAAIAGLILGMIGSSILAVGIGTFAMASNSAHYYSHKLPMLEKTHQRLMEAAEAIEFESIDTGELPAGIQGNKQVIEFQDAWGEALRYDRESDESFSIRSSGPDLEFDTEDDIVIRTDYQAEFKNEEVEM